MDTILGMKLVKCFRGEAFKFDRPNGFDRLQFNQLHQNLQFVRGFRFGRSRWRKLKHYSSLSAVVLPLNNYSGPKLVVAYGSHQADRTN